MKLKSTFYLALVVAALCCFFYFYENKQAPTPSGTELPRVFAFDRNQIDGLTISDHDQKIELVRDTNNRWMLKSPVTDRADQNQVDQVMTNLEILRKEDTLTGNDVGKGKLADYGLQTPRERLLITAHGGHPTEMLFGNETVLDGKTYLQLKGVNDVYVVGDELKKLLGKDVNSWRDHRLTDLAATDVNKLVLKDGTGEIELQRDGEHWKLVRPLTSRADDTKVNDTISRITNLEVASFVGDDKADAATYGLAEPKGTITLYTAKDPKGTEVLIGSATPDPKPTAGASPALPTSTPGEKSSTVYVRMPSRQSIYTVPNTINELLALKPADLRDHSLLRVNPDLVDRIHLTLADGSTFTLSHKDKAWTILDGLAANQAADTDAVAHLVDVLTGANIVNFVADSASDLAKYGLDKPLLQVKLNSFSSENTAESNAGEKPVAAASFGKGDDTVVYARSADEPFVVSLPKSLVDDLPQDPILWQTKTIYQGDAAKISSMEVAVKNRPTLALTHPDKGSWTLTTKVEGTLTTAKAESVANTLSRLRAMRWLGPVKPEYGLDQPAATLKFASTSDSKLSGRLVLGNSDSLGSVYAQVDGKTGAFLVSHPDYVVLTGELVPGTVPTPTPVPSAAPTATPAAPAEGSPAPAAIPAPTAVPATPPPTPMEAPVATPTQTPLATAAEATPMPTPEATPAATAAPTPMATATPAPSPEATPETAAAPSPTPLMTPADIPAPVGTPGQP